MRTIKRTVTPVLAFLLALLMAVYLFPADVAALPGGGEPEIIEPVGPAAEPEEQTVDALFELTEQRTADTKYIRMSDGTVKALTYGGAVHRADEDGVWREIDNSLTEKEESVESDRVSFVKTVSEDGALYTLTDGEKRISVSLAGAQPDTSVTVTNDGRNEEKFETKLEELSTLTKLVSSLRYNGILPETDLEYILHGEDLKENIVINAPSDSYTYSFTLSLENLTAELREDGAVVLYAEDEPAYIIPAPYMTDAENEYSDAVGYTLEDLGEGNYTLTVAADKDWIEEEGRVFPVTVDPTILHMQYRGFLQDTYVIAGNNTGYPNNANMRVGKVGASTVCKAYYSIGDMPQGMDLPLLSAQLQLRCNAFQYNGTDPVYLYLTRTESFLSDLTTITDQTNVPTVAESAIEIELSAGDTSFSFDLLDAYFLLETITDREVSYCLTMNDLFNTSVIVKSMESSYMPSLILSYGYCVPEEILSTSVSAHDKPFDLTNDRGQLEPGCTMLIPSGTALDNITYDPTNTAARLCFVRTGNNAETVKICFYGSGKYLSTVSASAGAPVYADPYGDWDSWTVIRLNTGAAIILSTSCSGMVLTRRVLPGTQIVSACVDYLSNDEISNQLWRIADPVNDGRTIDTGVYYINSNNLKQFLVSGTQNNLYVDSCIESQDEERMSWVVSYAGNGKYTFQNLARPNEYWSHQGFVQYVVVNNTFPEYLLFDITEDSLQLGLYDISFTLPGGSTYYLKATTTLSNDTEIILASTYDNTTKWRFCEKHDYVEFDPPVTDYQLLIDETRDFDVYDYISSAFTFTESTDFDSLTVTSGNNNVSISHDSGNTYTVTANAVDIVNIATVRHIPTNKTVSLGRVWLGNAIWSFKYGAKRLSGRGYTSILADEIVELPQEDDFGKQLWYTDYQQDNNENYYYIHSLHVINKKTINNQTIYDDNCVLSIRTDSGYFGTLILKSKDEASDLQKWKIEQTINGGYIISNKEYPNYKIAIDNSNNIIASSNNFTEWTFEPAKDLILPSCAWDGGYNENSIVHHIKIEIDETTFNDETPNEESNLQLLLTNNQHYDMLYGVWNSIASNIVIHYPNDSMSGVSHYTVVTIGKGSLPANGIARTQGNNMNETTNSTWNNCYITINSLYCDENATVLIQSIRHELGHALKLSHTFNDETGNDRYATNPDSGNEVQGGNYYETPGSVILEKEVISIMNYRNYRNTTDCWQTFTPSFIDKYNLIRKWGVQ